MEVVKYDVEYNEKRLPALVADGSVIYDGCSSLSNSDLAMMFMRDALRLDKKTEEHAAIVAVDAKCKPLGIFDVSHGSLRFTSIGVREIFQRLLLIGACGFFVAHNHPSGDATPSDMDCTMLIVLSCFDGG